MPSSSRSSRASDSQRRPSTSTLPGVGGEEAFADLDGGRLSGAVGAEQAEALAGRDLEVEAIDGDDIVVSLPESLDPEGGS